MDSFRESFNAAVENAVDKVRDMACTDGGPSSMAMGVTKAEEAHPRLNRLLLHWSDGWLWTTSGEAARLVRDPHG